MGDQNSSERRLKFTMVLTLMFLNPLLMAGAFACNQNLSEREHMYGPSPAMSYRKAGHVRK